MIVTIPYIQQTLSSYLVYIIIIMSWFVMVILSTFKLSAGNGSSYWLVTWVMFTSIQYYALLHTAIHSYSTNIYSLVVMLLRIICIYYLLTRYAASGSSCPNLV